MEVSNLRDKKKLGMVGFIIFGAQFMFYLIQGNFLIEVLVIALLFLFFSLYSAFNDTKTKK